jgi:hypothetical protein
MSGFTLLRKIAPANFNPKRLLGQPEETRSLRLGVLLGQIRGYTETRSEDDQILEGVTGRFKWMPDEVNNPGIILGSEVCWFPSGFGSDLIGEGKRIDKEKTGEVFEFGMVVSVVRSSAPAGYSWALEPLGQPESADPFAALQTKLGVAPALAAAQAPEQLEAPKPAGKAKANA